ncbi:18890_t:CDS:2 [Gigaspora margarita]|uniref:18890_t:CDS:1 n=1 Tax=Gigaspora margarita TaxID=4874 RepID=A0ABN7UCN8_GIGMA|nr:18890_t:CDS:2 [Gigaspora margarita]
MLSKYFSSRSTNNPKNTRKQSKGILTARFSNDTYCLDTILTLLDYL